MTYVKECNSHGQVHSDPGDAMWHWKVERHAKKLNALSARYRVEARKIGFLVETLQREGRSGKPE